MLKMWLIKAVEAAPSLPDQTQPPQRRSRRVRRRRDRLESGKLSLKVQVGIIAVALGIAVIALLGFLGLIGRPSQPVVVSQEILDATD